MLSFHMPFSDKQEKESGLCVGITRRSASRAEQAQPSVYANGLLERRERGLLHRFWESDRPPALQTPPHPL